VAALTAALAACAIGGGVAIANATPTRPRRHRRRLRWWTLQNPATPPMLREHRTRQRQEGDQNGPEVPDTTVAPAPPGR